MVHAEATSQEDEDSRDEDPQKPDALNMDLHLDVARVVLGSLEESSDSDTLVVTENDSLQESVKQELAVVQFSNAASNPKAVMVILPNTATAVGTMLRSVRQLFYVADLTTTILRYLDFSRVTNALI